MKTKPPSTGKVIALVVLCTLLAVSLYNLFVGDSAKQRDESTERHVRSWFRTQIETPSVRQCLRAIWGDGVATAMFELIPASEGRLSVQNVSVGESPGGTKQDQAIRTCLEPARGAVFDPKSFFDRETSLVLSRRYRFPFGPL